VFRDLHRQHRDQFLANQNAPEDQQVCDAESKTPVHKYQHIVRTGVVFSLVYSVPFYVDAKLAQ
jgi:hypothetical protein